MSRAKVRAVRLRFARLRRARRRWSTTFGRFVAALGVPRVADELDVGPGAVYEWLAGRSSPDFERRRALVRMSAGRLDAEAIDRHREEVAPT